MTELLTQIGVGGLIVILILRELRPILLSKKNGNGNSSNVSQDTLKEIRQDVTHVKEQVSQLHSWHDVDFPGQPGVKAWYATPLSSCIKELSNAVKQLADRLDKLDPKDD